jgi:hypothetical protein
VLKVGLAGPNSNARWNAHHYGINRAPSTLARKLIDGTEHWASLGIVALSPSDVGEWLRQSTDRDHFLFREEDRAVSAYFEKFLQDRLHPLFEG